MDTLGIEIGGRRLTAQLGFSLFAMLWALSTRGGVLAAQRMRTVVLVHRIRSRQVREAGDWIRGT